MDLQYSCCGIDDYEDFDTAANWKKQRTFEVTVSGVKTNQTVNLATPMACCKFTGTFPDLGSPVDETCAYQLPLSAAINNYETVSIIDLELATVYSPDAACLY